MRCDSGLRALHGITTSGPDTHCIGVIQRWELRTTTAGFAP